MREIMNNIEDKLANIKLELRELNSSIKILHNLFCSDNKLELKNMEDLASMVEYKSDIILKQFDNAMDEYAQTINL